MAGVDRRGKRSFVQSIAGTLLCTQCSIPCRCLIRDSCWYRAHLICSFHDQTVIALELRQPIVSRVHPAVMLESLTHGIHVVPHAHKPDIVARAVNPVTALARNRLGMLPSFFCVQPPANCRPEFVLSTHPLSLE